MRLALWVLLYSDYLRPGYLTVVHVETFTKLNQRSHILGKMLGGLCSVGISWRRITRKLVDKCKINTLGILRRTMTWQKAKSVHKNCLQFFVPRKASVWHPFTISGVSCKGDSLTWVCPTATDQSYLVPLIPSSPQLCVLGSTLHYGTCAHFEAKQKAKTSDPQRTHRWNQSLNDKISGESQWWRNGNETLLLK